MPITLFLVRLAFVLFMLLLFLKWEWTATALVWVLFIGFFVMLAEALNLINWAAGALFGKHPPSDG